MSLVFRRVKRISRKKRKFSVKTRRCYMDAFEDDSSKFYLDEDTYSDNFPSLNSVYKKDIFGTPIMFKTVEGRDSFGPFEVTVVANSIVFMKEYRKKSFEELRCEDYQSNRKGVQIFQDKNYLKCLAKVFSKTFEFFEPLPKNIHKNLSKDDCSLLSKKKVLHKISEETTDVSKEHLREVKERSILTSVDKLSTALKPKEDTFPQAFKEVPSKNISKTDNKLNNRPHDKLEILQDNLNRYFSKIQENATIPYDLNGQCQKFYLPCSEISFTYQNARPSIKYESDFILNVTHTDPYGYSRIFDNLEPLYETDTLSDSLYGSAAFSHNELLENCLVKKYTPDNKFCREYFFNKLTPYTSRRYVILGSKNFELGSFGVSRISKTKSFLLGKNK